MLRTLLAWIAFTGFALSATHAAGRLELSLISSKEAYILGEPVSILARLANVGDEPIQAPKYLRPEYGALVYRIDSPADRSYSPWALKEPADLHVTLQPGQTLEESVDLFYGADGWTFREPGRYLVTTSFAEVVKSAPLSIIVQAPSTDAQRAAAEQLLSSDEAGLFLALGGGDHLRSGKAVLEAVARDQPSTPHSAYADVALGISLLKAARDFSTGTARAANPAAAAERLSRVQVQMLPLEKTVEARVGLAAALRNMGQDSQAREVEEQLPQMILQRFPGADLEKLRQTTIPSISRQIP